MTEGLFDGWAGFSEAERAAKVAHGRQMPKGCPPAPTWNAWTYSGTGAAGTLLDAEVRQYTPNSNTKHTVFVLHGIGGSGTDMANYYGTSLDQTDYQDLIFVFASSSASLYGYSGWNQDCFTTDAGYGTWGVPQITHFMNYLDTNGFTEPGIKTISMGFSDGGRLSVYLNLFNQNTDVYSACGMAGHPHGPGGHGDIIAQGIASSDVKAIATWTANDFWYDSAAMPAYAAELSLGSPTTDTVVHDSNSFVSSVWESGSNRLSFVVEGTPCTPTSASCPGTWGTTGTMWVAPSHTGFLSDGTLIGELTDNCIAQFFVDIAPPSGGGGGGHPVDFWLEHMTRHGKTTAFSADREDKPPGLSHHSANYNNHKLRSADKVTSYHKAVEQKKATRKFGIGRW